MKKRNILFTLLIALSLLQTAYAQENTKDSGDAPTLNPIFGLKFNYISAYNTANFSDGHNSQFKNKSGIGFGAFLDIPFSQKWGIQLGLNYTQLGTKLSGFYFNNYYATNQTLKYNYITIPLLAKYKIANSGLSVMAGPQIGILTSATRYDGAGNNENVKSNLNSNDFAAVGGLEYTLPLKDFSHQVRIGASYQAGISNIIKDVSTNSYNKMYNNSFSAYAAFAF